MHNSNNDFPPLNNPNVNAKPINKPTEITFKSKQQNTYVKSDNPINRNKQANVSPAQDEISLQSCIRSPGSIIRSQKIIYASKISNNRICIYLMKE